MDNSELKQLRARHAGLVIALRNATRMLSRRDLDELGKVLSGRRSEDRSTVDLHDAIEIVAHRLAPFSMEARGTKT